MCVFVTDPLRKEEKRREKEVGGVGEEEGVRLCLTPASLSPLDSPEMFSPCER